MMSEPAEGVKPDPFGSTVMRITGSGATDAGPVRPSLLGPVEIAEVADQAGQDPAPLVAENLLDQDEPYWAGGATTGRISTEPPIRAAGIRTANSVA